ncbi:glycoside hydrolase family 97 catalytic domain-containing protein [candidate division KSB1 bacterium]|nr:glycoside hydrolase family 97 catalytic domain-containing protein [candidate division KSB1 bacterium]RQW01897.1 MAG: glycoside hydrolase family 97 protein [candidate division KSB1 bacterium]
MRSSIASALIVISLLFTSCASKNGSNLWTVKSPDGKLEITVELSSQASDVSSSPGEGSLRYWITYGKKVVMDKAPLGLECEGESFAKNLVFRTASFAKIDETYTLHNGKRRNLHSLANQLILALNNENGTDFELIVRAFDDGVAFKYALPGEGEKIITREASAFKIPAGTAYIMPYDDPGQWWPAYENFYGEYAVGASSPTQSGWAFPALFRINDGAITILITESGLNGSYCGTHLEKDAPDGLYQVRLPEEADGEGVGKSTPVASLPWQSSWKVIIIGDSPGDIVESSLVTHVADPLAYAVSDYIKPGRAAWSWWSDSASPRNFAKQKTFIDLAADMGWEYYLLDANWNYEPMADLLDFINYADDKRVGVLVWYNSGGPHNSVTEAPRDRLFERERRRQEFQWLSEIGVKGVKVDFWHSDKQDMIKYYTDLLRDANDFQILVNFHGCTIPRGWERTFPNLLTLEAVNGAEQYKFNTAYPRNATWHNVNLVFTRNAIGPMDYTPVTFTDMENPHLTTVAHELALSIVFQSGILHFADKPDGYRTQPETVQQFLREVPVTWDEIKFLHGEPGKFVVLARRSGDTWHLGGISGLEEEKTVTIDARQFGVGEVLFIGDEAARSFKIQKLPNGVHEIKMAPYGGFVMTVKSDESR